MRLLISDPSSGRGVIESQGKGAAEGGGVCDIVRGAKGWEGEAGLAGPPYRVAHLLVY